MYNVLKYIHENITQNITLTDVAEKFGYSKWHFSSKFHKYTGKSFTKYIRHFRLSLASIDILEGKKISDIAFSYGYDSISGFNKALFRNSGVILPNIKITPKKHFFIMKGEKHQCINLRKDVKYLEKELQV